MTDAPEKIWAYHSDDIGLDYDGAEIVAYSKPQPHSQKYLRSDIAQAMIAAAYEDAAQMASPSCVKQLTPTDARAALDALLKAEREAGEREAREKALREAAEVAGVKPRKGGKPVSGPHHAGLRDGREEAKRLILALISKDTTDGQ